MPANSHSVLGVEGYSMKLKLTILTFETTRRCNMCCTHCVRGPAQCVDIAPAAIRNTVQAIESIDLVEFTGGEPSLYPAAIWQFTAVAAINMCSVASFSVVTNAFQYNEAFSGALTDLFEFVEQPSGCTLVISQDQYHPLRSADAVRHYEKLPFFYGYKTFPPGSGLINDGMAKLNHLDSQIVEVPEDIFAWKEDDGICVDSQIYINALGDVLLHCDLSYESQKKHVIGNVLREPLDEIILRLMQQSN